MIKSFLGLATLFVFVAFSYGQSSNVYIEEIIDQLTLEEKVKMCHAQSKFSSAGVARLGIPDIFMSDGPHGVREEIQWNSWAKAGWTNDSCTAFPALTCLAASFNPILSKKYGKAIGEEARFRNKEVLLGPGVNIYRTPLNGRNFEYMGEDPLLASKMVVPYIKGVQENGVAACVKHYVLNNQEVNRSTVNVNISDRALREIYLPAFKSAVHEGQVWSVMGSYNKYKDQWCSHNKVLINDILKDEWGFDGVLISDWGATHSTRNAALYGLDIEMGKETDLSATTIENPYDDYFLAQPFLELLKSGEIDEEVLNDKVRRILQLMLRTNMDSLRPRGSMRSQQHFDVAREVAQEGIVLLKNEDAFFPLDTQKKISVAVLGENATRMMTKGGGSSTLKALYEISPLQGIQDRFVNSDIIFARAYASGRSVYGKEMPSEYDAAELRLEAIKAAKKADIVLFVGGLNKNYQQDCENGDRKNYNLPYGQDDLLREILEVNKNTAVILMGGNAVAMPWVSDVKAIMQVWYPGSEGGNAIADVLSGDVNPSGKLPFTFPVKLEDNGAHAFGEISYPGVDENQSYKEDILVGYRWHDTKNIDPLFEFGFGLSYTAFEITGVNPDKRSYTSRDSVRIAVKIRNTGDVDGAEVIQLYAKDTEASVLRPDKELKAFKKVFLKAGESKSVDLVFAAKDLAFYDESISDWNLEAGNFELLIGTSSRDIRKTLNIEIKQLK